MEDGRSRFGDFGLWTLDFGLNRQPSLQILLETFLRLQVFRDDDDGPLRKKLSQQRGEKGLSGHGDAGKSQRFAALQSPGEGLHGGSLQNVSEQVACR